MSKREKPDDRLGLARNLLLAGCLVTGSLLALMLLDASLRKEPSFPLCEDLWLSSLSVVPSGRSFRNPEALHPAVDLRFSPLLPPVETGVAGLLLAEPGLLEEEFRR